MRNIFYSLDGFALSCPQPSTNNPYTNQCMPADLQTPTSVTRLSDYTNSHNIDFVLTANNLYYIVNATTPGSEQVLFYINKDPSGANVTSQVDSTVHLDGMPLVAEDFKAEIALNSSTSQSIEINNMMATSDLHYSWDATAGHFVAI